MRKPKKQQKPLNDLTHCRRLRGRPGRLLAGPLAEGARYRGSCHSCRERGGFSGAPARQDRPPRHRAAQARLLGLAARRAGPLQDVRDPDLRRGGCQAPPSRARNPRWRANHHHQPHQGDPGAARHPQLQSQAQEGAGAPGTPAHARGRADPAQYARRVAARHGAQTVRCRADTADREGAPGATKAGPQDRAKSQVLVLMRVIGIGIETADMLVKEILSRNMRDRRAVARYGGLTGSPHESGSKSREKGLARSGNARVRRGMIQLAWRFLDYQKDSALAKWFEARTKNGSRKKMIVALARKLLIALWHFVRDGVVPEGVVLRPAH